MLKKLLLARVLMEVRLYEKAKEKKSTSKKKEKKEINLKAYTLFQKDTVLTFYLENSSVRQEWNRGLE